MDVNAKIDELIEIVEAARAMPMSSSCVINRSQVLDLLDDLKRGMPEEIDHARQVIAKRESMVEDGRREAERIKERTRADRDSIIGNTDVSREARGSAERLMAQARHEAEQIRAEADEYVDQKLANFEVVLTKTLQAVGRGRDKMRGSHNPMEELGRHVDEEDLIAEERRRSRDFSGTEERERDGLREREGGREREVVRERERETTQFDGYESQEFTAEAFAEADRVYEQHSYQDDPYAPHTGEFAAQTAQHPGQLPQQGGYPVEQQPNGYGYEQGAYDQGAAQGYGTGEFTLEPQYAAEQGGYPEQAGYPEQQAAYGDPAAYGQAPQGYGQPQSQPQPVPGQYPADDTSYFDTGLIDVRQFQHDGYGR